MILSQQEKPHLYDTYFEMASLTCVGIGPLRVPVSCTIISFLSLAVGGRGAQGVPQGCIFSPSDV